MSHYVAQFKDKLSYLLTTVQLDEMMTISKRVLTVARRQGDKSLEGMALVGLANALRQKGKFHEARLMVTGAMKHAETHQDNAVAVDALIERGYIALDGFFQAYEAIADFREALQRTDDARAQAHAMAGIAQAYYDVGLADKATSWGKEGLSKAREALDMPTQVQILYLLARAYAQEQRLGRAEQCAQQARQMAQELDYRLYHFVGLVVVAEVGRQEVAPSDIVDIQQDMPVPQLALMYQTLIQHLARVRAYDDATQEAHDYLRLAQMIASKPHEAHAFATLGMVCALKRAYDDALLHYEQAVTIAREMMNPFQEAAFLQAMGQVASVQGDYDAAVTRYEQALALYRSLDNAPKAQQVTGALFVAYVLRLLAPILRLVGWGRRR
jgi:tetratricopeptide (TPR) repeat protein